MTTSRFNFAVCNSPGGSRLSLLGRGTVKMWLIHFFILQCNFEKWNLKQRLGAEGAVSQVGCDSLTFHRWTWRLILPPDGQNVNLHDRYYNLKLRVCGIFHRKEKKCIPRAAVQITWGKKAASCTSSPCPFFSLFWEHLSLLQAIWHN